MFSARKRLRCNRCNPPITFKRAYTFTMHKRTAHQRHVKKLVCPICKSLTSNLSNLRVHYKRFHKKKNLNNRTIQTLEEVWVKKNQLINGRFFESISSSDCDDPNQPDESDSSEDNEQLIHLARQAEWANKRLNVRRPSCLQSSSDEWNSEPLMSESVIDQSLSPLLISDELLEALIPDCVLVVGQSPLHEVEMDGNDTKIEPLHELLHVDVNDGNDASVESVGQSPLHKVEMDGNDASIEPLDEPLYDPEANTVQMEVWPSPLHEVLCQTFTVHTPVDPAPARQPNTIWSRRNMPLQQHDAMQRAVVNYSEGTDIFLYILFFKLSYCIIYLIKNAFFSVLIRLIRTDSIESKPPAQPLNSIARTNLTSFRTE